MSEFKIKISTDLDISEAEAKLKALANDNKIKLEFDMSNFNKQIDKIKNAFKDAFKVDSNFAKNLNDIAKKMQLVNKGLDESLGGSGETKKINALMQQYKELYKLREKLQKQMTSGKLGDDSIGRTSEQIKELEKQMSSLYNRMSKSQNDAIDLFNAKQSTKALVDMNNYLNKIESQATSLGTKLNSISFDHIDTNKIDTLSARLEEIQRQAREGIDLEFEDVGDIISDLNRISSEIKNLEKVENVASSFDKISNSIKEAGGDVENFASEIKNLENIAGNLDGSFDKAFKGINSELKEMKSNVNGVTKQLGSGGLLGTWDDFKGNFAQFTLAEVAGDFISSGIRKATSGIVDTVIETDSAIRDLNKVYEQGLTGEALDNYLLKVTEVAKNTGQTSVDIINATSKAVQSGIDDINEALEYGEQAAIFANVGDVDQGQADTMLASIMSAYVDGGVENALKSVEDQVYSTADGYSYLTKFIDLANYAGEIVA